jgi:hypothetical protein
MFEVLKKLFYGSGEYTRVADGKVKDGWHLGTDKEGRNTIETPQGYYVQTATVKPPHKPDWDRIPE